MYELWGNFIFPQLVANFAIFGNIIECLSKTIIHLKYIILQESSYFDNLPIFNETIYFQKKKSYT